MRFEYYINNQQPALSWLAVITKGSDVVKVHCGNAVITTEEWFAAGVWDGRLQNGEMDTCSTCCCTGMKTCVWGG